LSRPAPHRVLASRIPPREKVEVEEGVQIASLLQHVRHLYGDRTLPAAEDTGEEHSFGVAFPLLPRVDGRGLTTSHAVSTTAASSPR
jgi:hypothetical protein